MKTKISTLLSSIALLVGLSACEQPHEFAPTKYDEHFDSLTASFYDDDRDENKFPAEVDYAAKTICFVFPYNYPEGSDNILTPDDLKMIRIQANLKTGLVIEPAFTNLDFSTSHSITVVDPYGTRTQYTVTGEIRKSNKCELSDITLTGDGLAGVINQTDNTITFVTGDDLGLQNAEIIMSHGATISPDPRTELVDWDSEPTLTVTAQNGVDNKVYTVLKGVPSKIALGMREGSGKMRWVKKLSDVGIAPAANKHGASGFAVVGDYLVLNEVGNPTAQYINWKTGAVAGAIDLSAVGVDNNGNYNNYRMTSDNNGNILICCNSQDNGGGMCIWRKKGLDGPIERYLIASGGNQFGNALSVVGNLDGDAIITMTFNNSCIDFYKWQVKNGRLVNTAPTPCHITGYTSTCWGNSDVVYSNPSDPTSDYYCAAYSALSGKPSSDRGATIVDGKTNKVKASSANAISSNWIMNQADAITFNMVPYFVHNSVNTFTWGSDDCLYLHDTSGSDLNTYAVNFGAEGMNINKQYGATAAGNLGLGACANDVKLYVPGDGFYMYLFFEFTNGSVGCVQFDCIDM